MSESYAVSEKRELLLDRVRKFILDNGGIVKKSQLAGLGIDYRRILDFVEKGDILRIKSGYYAVHLSDFTEEELVAKLFPDCVLNLENALYAYGYIKKKPYGWRLAVDKNTSKSRFKMDYPKIIPMYAEPETLELGVTEIQLSDVTVRIFEKERLICECLKYEDKMDRERFKEGLMAYIKDPKKDIAKLMYYAKERKVVKKSSEYDWSLALNGTEPTYEEEVKRKEHRISNPICRSAGSFFAGNIDVPDPGNRFCKAVMAEKP